MSRTALADTVQRLAVEVPRVAAHAGAPMDLGDHGWVPALEVVATSSSEVDGQLARISARYPCDDRALPLIFFFWRYAWQLAVVAVGCYVTTSRALDLSASNVAVRFSEHGFADAVAVIGGRVGMLPDDAAAAHADARVVPDRDVLRAVLLRSLLDDHLAALVASARRRRAVGERALWATVEDALAGSLIWLGRQRGTPLQNIGEIPLFVRTPPLRGSAGALLVEHQGRSEPFLLRTACCRAYRLEGRGKCATCPLLPIPERERRLREHLAVPAS